MKYASKMVQKDHPSYPDLEKDLLWRPRLKDDEIKFNYSLLNAAKPGDVICYFANKSLLVTKKIGMLIKNNQKTMIVRFDGTEFNLSKRKLTTPEFMVVMKNRAALLNEEWPGLPF